MRLVIELDLDSWALLAVGISLAAAAALYFLLDFLANKEP